jgi:hypothetical protein
MPLPDYSGGSIVNLMASIIAGLGGDTSIYPPLACLPPEEVAAYRQVVLLIMDGLGCEFLQRRRARSSLEELSRARLTSVFPSTTAAAIPTFLTGEPVQQHGLVGWHTYFSELAAVLAVLPGVPRYGGVSLKHAGVDPARLFAGRPVFDRLPVDSFTVVPRRLAGSDFNLAHQGRAASRPYNTQDEFFQTIAALLHGGGRTRKFIYAYWPELDRISHEAGAFGAEADWHFTSWEAGFRRLLKLAGGTGSLILLTADHGFIDTDQSRTVDLDEHPELARCLALPLCGEHRVAYCYVRPDRQSDFQAYMQSELAGAVECRRSEELVEAGWFGLGEPHPRLRERIGDYTLIMKDNWIIRDWLPGERRFDHIGVHGGTSSQEMRVPLLTAAA